MKESVLSMLMILSLGIIFYKCFLAEEKNSVVIGIIFAVLVTCFFRWLAL